VSWALLLKKPSVQAGRRVFIKLGADWCGACRRMDRETFTEPRLIESLNRCTIPVRIDVDEQPELSGLLQVESIPTISTWKQLLGVVEQKQKYEPAAGGGVSLRRNLRDLLAPAPLSARGVRDSPREKCRTASLSHEAQGEAV